MRHPVIISVANFGLDTSKTSAKRYFRLTCPFSTNAIAARTFPVYRLCGEEVKTREERIQNPAEPLDISSVTFRPQRNDRCTAIIKIHRRSAVIKMCIQKRDQRKDQSVFVILRAVHEATCKSANCAVGSLRVPEVEGFIDCISKLLPFP